MTAPRITPETFPYRRKWTQEQLDEIFSRHVRLVEAMTDAVGPTGQVIYVPPDMLNILALHLALAGGEVQDRLAYIVGKPYVRPAEDDSPNRENSNQRVYFDDVREWVLRSEYEPGPPDPDETAAVAKAAAEKIRRQLPPEVMAQLAEIFIEETRKTTQANATTQRDLDEADALENEMRDAAREEGER